MVKTYRINPIDNVEVAFTDIPSGTTVETGEGEIKVLSDIPCKHKVAVRPIKKGEKVIKYGESLGLASRDIPVGEHVHLHNLVSDADKRREYTYEFDPEVVLPGHSDKTFLGYPRKSGEYGTRNYIAIISGTFCANSHINRYATEASSKFTETESFDGFIPLTHECGCGQAGEDLENAIHMVANFISNPNLGGVLFIELGCELASFERVKPYIKELDESRFRFIRFNADNDEDALAKQYLAELYEVVQKDKRVSCPISGLHVGLHCGSSDAFSGLTSNPLLGSCAEEITRLGGTATLTEVTEFIGGEHILMNHAIDRGTFQKIVNLINDQHDYLERYNMPADSNPGRGNHEGGITTIDEKSLGCVQKGGKCAIVDVLKYTQRATKHGYQLVYGTGNDIVGMGSQIAAGANIFLFSTGGGTPVATFAPTIKVTSNTETFLRKPQWCDFDAGRLIDGANYENIKNELLTLLIDVAEGRIKASNEILKVYLIGMFRDGVIV